MLKLAIVWLIPGLPAIILHECAHGWMAARLGDPTARDAGRLTLNPIRHIDRVGTILVPGLMLLFHSPVIFGWAKPVPVDFSRLRHGRWGVILVAVAGPLANFLMMLGWLALALFISAEVKTSEIPENSVTGLLMLTAFLGVGMNLALMLFNFVPIPPLDGGRIVGALLPDVLAKPYMRIGRFESCLCFSSSLREHSAIFLRRFWNFSSPGWV